MPTNRPANQKPFPRTELASDYLARKKRRREAAAAEAEALATEARDVALAKIASIYLHRDTLETQNSDRLDFSDQAVWSLKAALEAAYAAGKASK